MELYVKNTSFETIAVIDLYSSAIWTERYTETGDFQLILPFNKDYLSILAMDNYLTLQGTDRAMIVESMNLESDISTGERNLTYKGRSLESILERRIVWRQKELDGSVETVIRTLLNENIISPPSGQEHRRIPNFIFPTITDPDVKSVIDHLELKVQFTGDTVLTAVKTVCDRFNLGFKITLNASNQFVFSLYYGKDRTVNQTDTDAIIFSPEYDTLINSRYESDYAKYRNIALVLGEDQGNSRRRAIIYDGKNANTDFDAEDGAAPSGLSRRELYVDARDLQSERSEEDGGGTMSDEEYLASLESRGYTKLDEAKMTAVFDGEVEHSVGPQYGTNYFLGDYVTIQNEFGMSTEAQITEYIRSYDGDKGYSAYPTFVMKN